MAHYGSYGDGLGNILDGDESMGWDGMTEIISGDESGDESGDDSGAQFIGDDDLGASKRSARSNARHRRRGPQRR